ncbi:MAG: DUF502 domain-containing protein [Planctomycetota bacterium]
MNRILKYFFRGLLVVVPGAVTVYVLASVFAWLDNLVNVGPLFGVRVPGAGAVLALAAITVVGFLASNFIARGLLRIAEALFQRVPLARFVYVAMKDLMEAIVGEKRRFDKPVVVSIGGVEALGFITRQDMEWIGRKELLAVYFPQSYNIAGNLVLLPRDRVTPLRTDASEMLRFIVSGGVSGSASPGGAAS